MDTISFTDSAIAQITQHLARNEPERGGALMGIPGVPIITHYIADELAVTTGATYSPSLSGAGNLQQLIDETGTQLGLELKGVAHSHPGNMDRPSGQDGVAFADNLRRNPQMPFFVAPIITLHAPSRTEDVDLDGAKLTVYVASRETRGDAVRLARAAVLPVVADTLDLAAEIGGRLAGQVRAMSLNGSPMIGVDLTTGDQLVTALFPASGYPEVAPILTTADADGTRRPLPLTWDHTVPPERRLAEAGRAVLTPPATHAPTGLQARLGDLAPSGDGVVVIGCGSVGSQLAELLARAGLERVTLIDPDTVEAPNLSRSVYTRADIGAPKVHALARRLREINPDVDVEPIVAEIAALSRDSVERAFSGASLIVGATDDPRGQVILNSWSYEFDVPALYVGLYRRGYAGEVIYTVPGLTRCYRCVTAVRHQSAIEQTHDYGTDGRLAAEIALGSDIANVTSIGAKVALALISLTQPDHPLVAEFLLPLLAAHGGARQMVVHSTVDRWGFFPDVFGDVPGQGPFGSVWISAAGDPTCDLCGDSKNAGASEAAEAPAGVPSAEDIRELFGADVETDA